MVNYTIPFLSKKWDFFVVIDIMRVSTTPEIDVRIFSPPCQGGEIVNAVFLLSS